MPSCLKRIIALCMIFVICFSLCLVPARADFGDYVSQFWDWVGDTPTPVDLWDALFQSDSPSTAYNSYVNKRQSPIAYSSSSYYLKAQAGSYFKPEGFLYDLAGKYHVTVKSTPYTFLVEGSVTDIDALEYSLTRNKHHYLFTAPATGSYYLQMAKAPPATGNFYIFPVGSTETDSYDANTNFFNYTDVSEQPALGQLLDPTRPVRSKAPILLQGGTTYEFKFYFFNFMDRRMGYNSNGIPFRAETVPFEMVPAKPSSDDNTPSTRVGVLNGDYIGPDGTKYANTYIVNETNNTVYNPVTGETYNISEWNYDYSTRTYNITIDNSQTINITYGDEYVTIQEGDTITNIYYGGGTETPSPDPGTCQHAYVDTVTTDPGCTTQGVKTRICSKCAKKTYEAVPAKGHTWVVERTVQTTYDEAGTLVQKGYTLYKCSVCNEQYKDEAGTGPPGPPSGGGGSGGEDGKDSIWDKIGGLLGGIGNIFITIVEATIGKLLDGFISLVTMVNEKIESVVTAILGLFDRIPQFFGGFTAFLVAVFPFLPQEFFDIIILTIALVGLAFLIKFCLKR